MLEVNEEMLVVFGAAFLLSVCEPTSLVFLAWAIQLAFTCLLLGTMTLRASELTSNEDKEK